MIPFINGEKFGTEWKLNISKQGLDRKCFLAMIYKSASLAYGSLNARYDRVKDAQSLGFGHCYRTCKPLVNSFEYFFDAPDCLSSRPVLVCEVNPWLVTGVRMTFVEVQIVSVFWGVAHKPRLNPS